MHDLIILVLALIIGFLIWNGRAARYADPVAPAVVSAPNDDPVPPDVTQVILEKVQQTLKANYPIETLYIKNTGNDTYSARFMFFSTDGYYGTQYDVSARVGTDGTVEILSRSETAVKGDSENPAYVPDKYQAFSTIEENLDRQLTDAVARSRKQS